MFGISGKRLFSTSFQVAQYAKGFLAAGVRCGIKKRVGLDFALVTSEVPCSAAAVFTTNKFKAAPVLVSQRVLQQDPQSVSSLVVNSGCANACTGAKGEEDAESTIKKISEVGLGRSLVMSTGVIGPFLDLNKIYHGISEAKSKLSPTGWEDASKAIMTTDTKPKLFTKTYSKLPKSFTITGIAKGAGMIHPNMATMLSIMTTDFNISPVALTTAVKYAADRSFNSISIDGDTSTNDTFAVLANGMAGNDKVSDTNSQEYLYFRQCLTDAASELSKLLVKDGEGATKFVTVLVEGADSYEEAKRVANSISKSNLVKTAFFGQDANWGRIVCAVGYSGAEINPKNVNMWFGKGENGGDELHLVKNGAPYDTNEEKASAILKENAFRVRVNLGKGKESATMWTCDFSVEYVHINADYRS